MANFLTSTQRHLWMFPASQLAETRREVNQRTVDAIRQHEAAGEGPGQLDGGGAGEAAPCDMLTVEEEAALIVFYQQKIQETCAGFKFPHKLQATSIVFHKRFYLVHSVMDYHPKNVMLTCIYLACKSEEVYVFAEEFCKRLGQDPKVVLDLELVVLQALKFHLIVFHPYRSLDGLLQELGTTLELRGVARDAEAVRAMGQSAVYYLDNLMLTDAIFFHPPGQGALAALRYSARKCGLWGHIESHVHELVQRAAGLAGASAGAGAGAGGGGAGAGAGAGAKARAGAAAAAGGGALPGAGAGPEQIGAILDSIDALRDGGRPERLPSMEELKRIDLKWQKCRNPATNPAHVVFKREGDRANAEKHEKRKEKANKKKAAAAAAAAATAEAQAALEASGMGHAAKRRKSGDPTHRLVFVSPG